MAGTFMHSRLQQLCTTIGHLVAQERMGGREVALVLVGREIMRQLRVERGEPADPAEGPAELRMFGVLVRRQVFLSPWAMMLVRGRMGLP